MAKRSNVATVVIDKKKYFIESDAIADITMKTGIKHEGVRVVGINVMGDGLRVVGKDGISEIPTNLIKHIQDSKNSTFPGVTVK